MSPPQVCQNFENHGPFPANFCKTPSWTWLHRVMFVGVSSTAPSTYQSLDNRSFLTPLGPGSVLGSTQSRCGFCPPGARLGKAENEWGNKQEGVSGPRKSYGGNETGDVVESDGETTSDTVGRGDLVTGSLPLKGQPPSWLQECSLGRAHTGWAWERRQKVMRLQCEQGGEAKTAF